MEKKNFGFTINVLLRKIKTMSGFIYKNVNPLGKEEEDCVCRALSIALKIDYCVVDRMLDFVSKYYNCDKLCICCYHHLLEDIFGLDTHYCYNYERVNDIMEEHPNDIVIIRMEGHLTASYYGTILDTYDCRDRVVDRYWVVK